MSLVIAGNQANITTPLSATVSAIANNGSGKWRVTTAAAHLFGNGDFVHLSVTIAAVLVNAYGFITVIDATHFDVPSLSFSATGTGSANDLSLTPQVEVPTDGDSFSLQLSGMLSAQQGTLDRTQALRYMQLSRTEISTFATATGNVAIPPWVTYLLLDGCGGGGGGGGGPGGFQGSANQQLPAGGGGAGAKRTLTLVPIPAGTTSIDVTIGAGGTGGTAGAGGVTPTSGGHGGDGGATTLAWHDGPSAGVTFARFLGGAGGGGGQNTPAAVVGSSGTPAFTPGGRGPAGLFRSGPGAPSQLAPGYRQLQNINNASGTLSVPSGAWPTALYTDPVGQMDYQEGGASVANANNATYAAAASYDGAAAPEGPLGGSAGGYGTPSGIWPPGAGGGGGGAGGFGAGGAGGPGGNGSTGTGTAGTAGTAPSSNTGAGGGGGGGGGNANTTAGAGAAGAAGSTGFAQLIFLAPLPLNSI